MAPLMLRRQLVLASFFQVEWPSCVENLVEGVFQEEQDEEV